MTVTADRPLKIAIVHAADRGGGAENCVVTLHRSLLELGHDSQLFVGYHERDLPQVQAVARSRPFPGALRLARTVESLTGLQNVYSHGFREAMRSLPSDVDVVHLHSLWGSGHFADLGGLAVAARRFPTVLTMHDEWLLTGHCACTHRCERWRTGCGRCPDLSIPPAVPRDATRWNFLRKRRVIGSAPVHVTTVSAFLKAKAEQSPIMAGKPISVVYNGFDLQTFAPGNRAEARRALGLPTEGLQVLLAGQTVDGILQGIAQQAARALDALADPHVTALLVGRLAAQVGATMTARHRVMPYQETAADMARCYRAADLTLVSSEVETFGRIAAESLACGTPVITSDAGGLPEVVPHDVAGLVVPNRHVPAFAAALRELINAPQRREQMGRAGMAWVRERFADQAITQDYLDVYRHAILEREAAPARAHRAA